MGNNTRATVLVYAPSEHAIAAVRVLRGYLGNMLSADDVDAHQLATTLAETLSARWGQVLVHAVEYCENDSFSAQIYSGVGGSAALVAGTWTVPLQGAHVPDGFTVTGVPLELHAPRTWHTTEATLHYEEASSDYSCEIGVSELLDFMAAFRDRYLAKIPWHGPRPTITPDGLESYLRTLTA